MPASISARVTVSARCADVGEAADHQDLVARAQVFAQRTGQRAQHLAALRLQFVGVQGEQHAAADADAAIDQGDAPLGERRSQRPLQRLASLLGDFALVNLVAQPGFHVQLHADHADQDQREHAQQHRHQVAERGPDRRGFAIAVDVGLDLHAQAACDWSAAPCAWRRSSTICFCASRLRSITSRAWAT